MKVKINPKEGIPGVETISPLMRGWESSFPAHDGLALV